jgi:streptogramin lyase
MTYRRLRLTIAQSVVLGAIAAIVVAMPAGAASTAAGERATAVRGTAFPTEFALPDGFLPEGIAIGGRPYAFFGSRADGDIFRVNLVTGEGTVISQGPGTPSVGMKVDHRSRLFVAGGTAGDGRVVDTDTGEILESYQFTTEASFVNDVVLTPDAAWFTDSLRPVLYKVPLGRAGGLPDPSDVVELPLGGDYVSRASISTASPERRTARRCSWSSRTRASCSASIPRPVRRRRSTSAENCSRTETAFSSSDGRSMPSRTR